MPRKAKSEKPAAKAAAKAVTVQRRWVAPNRIQEREALGWARVQGKDTVLRNGSVLMEKQG